MVNQKLHIGLVALALSSIVVLAVALPAANALTPRNFQYFNDNHVTATYQSSGPYVCGDKVCSADEWSKMRQDLRAAQRDQTACPQLKSWEACGAPVSTKSG